MKFAHLADCHIGGWREPQLKELTIQSFEKAIETCIVENVDFVIVCGDLFDTALPSIELLKRTTKSLNELKEHSIPVYIIPGSHDFSPSGKTMLEVLEKAKLVINVTKFKDNKLQFTTDNKTGTKLTGMLGKKACLEIEDFRTLEKAHLEAEKGFKIFMFHTAIEELKPSDLDKVECTPLSLLPKNFNYYAGGHVHYILNKDDVIGKIAFPGPLFPNNIKEIEKLKHGSFYIVEKPGEELFLTRKEIKIKEVASYVFDASNKEPDEVEKEIIQNITNFQDKIVTIRVRGTLSTGKPSDINFRRIYSHLDDAYIILKNTNKLTSKDATNLKINVEEEVDVEKAIIKEYKEKEGLDELMIIKLMGALNKNKEDGEKNTDFENRIIDDTSKVLRLNDDTEEN